MDAIRGVILLSFQNIQNVPIFFLNFLYAPLTINDTYYLDAFYSPRQGAFLLFKMPRHFLALHYTYMEIDLLMTKALTPSRTLDSEHNQQYTKNR